MANLIGEKFGKLTVIGEYGRDKHKQILWKCECSCDDHNIVIATTGALRSHHTVSCGCRKRKDLTGEKFGSLTAIRPVGKNKSRQIIWEFKCDCGKIVNYVGTRVSNGYIKSCGHALDDYLDGIRNDYTGTEFDGFIVERRLPTTETKSVPYECRCKYCGNKFIVTDHALRQNCVSSCGCTYGSKLELEIADYIKSLDSDVEMLRQYRLFGDRREVDIYLPKYKLAIEINGSFIHSSEGNRLSPKPHYYHQKKFIDAKEKGIHLINIFDVDWNDKVKAILKDIIVKPKKIFARKCICSVISKKEANEFFEKYHLSGGNRSSKFHYGLFYNNELMSVMSFGNIRYSSGMEIIRYVTKSGYTIIGGAEKLFKHFVRENNIKEVMTYSDNDYFDGSIYERLGFVFNSYTTPDYYWYSSHKGILSREKCQPKILKEKYPDLYDSSAKSVENDIMIKLKYVKVYRCGNSKWYWKEEV